MNKKAIKFGLPLTSEYTEKGKRATISKNHPFEVSHKNQPLALLSKLLKSGKIVSLFNEGKEYVFGRGLEGKLYCMNVQNSSKKDTGIAVADEIPEIHFYVRSLKNYIEILRIGQTPLKLTNKYTGHSYEF